MDDTVTETRTEVKTVTDRVTVEKTRPVAVEYEVELTRCPICEQLYETVIPITVGFHDEQQETADVAHAVVCEHCAINALDFGRADLDYLDVDEMDHRGKRFHDLHHAHYRAVLVIGIALFVGGIIATVVPPLYEMTPFTGLIGGIVGLIVLLALYPDSIADTEHPPTD